MPLVTTNAYLTRDLVNSWMLCNRYIVFGDNTERRGYGGQAAACRGFPNAIGISTKLSPSEYAHDGSKLFFRNLVADLDLLNKRLHAGCIVYYPAAGIGTGLADMPNQSPKNWLYLQFMLKRMQELYGTEEN